MNYIFSKVSSEKKFFGNTDPVQLSEKYGTPLYVYNENILRNRCRDMKGLISYSNFTVNYSPFMDGEAYLQSTFNILSIARQFNYLESVDLGGGFGIPYKKQSNQPRFDLKALSGKLSEAIHSWVKDYGKDIEFKIEPGRYIVAESSILLGKVNAIKTNYNNRLRPAEVLISANGDPRLIRRRDTLEDLVRNFIHY